LTITVKKLLERKSNLLRLAALRKKKKERFKDLESYRKKHKIDKLKLMLSEPKELSKKARELLEIRKEKNLNTNRKF